MLFWVLIVLEFLLFLLLLCGSGDLGSLHEEFLRTYQVRWVGRCEVVGTITNGGT